MDEHICRFNDPPQRCDCYGAGVKDCQRKTLELLLPEKEDVDESSYNDPSIDGTGVSIGVNIARSEILQRASEAGIDIEGL